MKKVYIVFGLIAFSLGTVGILLPVLPTTPFLLIASFCFVRGSEGINNWFIKTWVYKKYLEEFIKEGRMSKKQKIFIPSFATLLISIPFICIDHFYMRLTLFIIILIKWYYFIFKIETQRE